MAKQIIHIDGVKYYRRPMGSHRSKYGVCYRKAPPSKNKPRKAKKQRQTKRIGPKKVIERDGVKWYLVDGDGLKGDVAVAPGALDVDVVVEVCPAHTSSGYTFYRRNPTRVINGVEHFRVRSGVVRSGDRLSTSHTMSTIRAVASAGTMVASMMCIAWRPVKEKVIEMTFHEALAAESESLREINEATESAIESLKSGDPEKIAKVARRLADVYGRAIDAIGQSGISKVSALTDVLDAMEDKRKEMN